MNQGLVSTGGKYSLRMQNDGNLVMYRADGSVRWAAGRNGFQAVMQGDGNFVLYTNFGPPWHTATYGRSGSYLAVQDDGNLVVYLPFGQGAIWSIGADPLIDGPNPRYAGDVLGRDLSITGLGAIGHVAVWDGRDVVQAMPGLVNAVEFTSLRNFKAASTYWGVASPNVPAGNIYSCFYAKCNPANNGDWSTVDARTAMALRARQIQAIGANYTITPLGKR